MAVLLVNILCTLHVLLNMDPKAKENPMERHHVLAYMDTIIKNELFGLGEK